MSTATTAAAWRMAQFARLLTLQAIPHDVQMLARLHVADAIGVGLAASNVPSHREFMAKLLAQCPRGGKSTVLGAKDAVYADTAALLNGTSIHSLEYDDTHMRSIVHGSAVIVPPVLAVAQEQGLPLSEVLRLTVVGWELLVRVGQAAAGAFQRRGFQVTSVGGAVVAAILATAARGADVQTIARAAGIAGSQASGIFEFLSDGSNVKALHPGWAAHAGVWAASLAMSGMTGPASVLEGKHGIYAAYADDRSAGDRLSNELDSLEDVWTLREAAFKFHPCCHYIHPYLEAAGQLREQAAGMGLRIVGAHCLVAAGAGLVIAQPWERKQAPRDTNDAKYSLPYCVALALLNLPTNVGAMTTGPLNEQALNLAAHISAASWEESGFPERFGADVSVTLENGAILRASVPQVIGSAQRPATVEQIQEKFLNNAGSVMPPLQVRTLWDALLNDDALPSLIPA
ncbi:2-methylcitrate dehydratase [Bordetella tumbae]|uniref:MmgE/PrpD family protein n=1 Tax=Bordetella tumbae TaxID=1649139 RepID=UPI0039EF7437